MRTTAKVLRSALYGLLSFLVGLGVPLVYLKPYVWWLVPFDKLFLRPLLEVSE
jgi:hypothetical protein